MDIIGTESQHTSGVYAKRDLTIVRGEGALLWDDRGNEYIDCVGGQGTANLGHAHPKIVQAIHERRRKFGEKFWFYTCGARGRGNAVSPFIYYHHSYLAPRMHAWMAWHLEADGMLVFAMTGVPDSVRFLQTQLGCSHCS